MMKLVLFFGSISVFIGSILYPGLHEPRHPSAQVAKVAELPHLNQHDYIGSQRCADCHSDYSQSCKASGHSQMIRPAILEGPNRTVMADFSKPDPGRPFEFKDVKWVIGHRWKQRFIGEVNGQEVVFPGQWSIKEKRWQPYTGKTDWWYPRHPDWKTRSNFELCAGCHSTGVDIGTRTWTEQNITCESCHGPGRAHAENPTKQNIVNPSRLTTQRSIEICLSCHQSGRPPGEQYAWAVGYQPGKRLSDFWKGTEPEPGKTTVEFWSDGTAHKNRVQGNTFTHSVMFHNGIQCTDCHNAHGSRYLSMTVKSASTNALCLTCHGPGKTAGPSYLVLSDHTHHSATSTGSECMSCHMPKTGENSVGGESRDHTFNFVSPSVSIGNKQPNSCNLCHSDKSAEWALAQVKRWYPNLK